MPRRLGIFLNELHKLCCVGEPFGPSRVTLKALPLFKIIVQLLFKLFCLTRGKFTFVKTNDPQQLNYLMIGRLYLLMPKPNTLLQVTLVWNTCGHANLDRDWRGTASTEEIDSSRTPIPLR